MSHDRAALAATLTDALHLTQPPIGVAFTDALPAGVPAFTGRVAAGCRFWQEATREVFATTAADHDLCAIGTLTHNLETTPAHLTERSQALKVFGDLGYVRPDDLPFIPVLGRRPKHVVYGPLDRIPVQPDVVLLFVRPDQTLVLSEASQQMEAGLPPAMGRPACAVVPQAANSGRTALSLGCCGARAYLDAFTPDIALYAVPGSRLEVFTERVAALARANAVLTAFHQARRRDVESGKNPTIKESLAALAGQ
ncbi:MAG TPA: DUF169 domain-containing protein [Candidatus Polarisedimenticolia bacterium]|nr:DUF169 domain-containing protein [Candidatus Polarisedimenticolia bacterium]